MRQKLRDDGLFDRVKLALGVDTIGRVSDGQSIAIVGVGGLGSAIAENLIHMGFHNLHVIDPDYVEVSNVSRIVGASYEDAINARLKVDVVQHHLQAINPHAAVSAHACGVEDPSVEAVLAEANWIVVATDSHWSRFTCQRIALKYFVPIISAGVSITVDAHGMLQDMSGEVITIRAGDHLCLNCLGRLNPQKIAVERSAETIVAEELIRRGYVAGLDLKEPAVKTLNCSVAALAVDRLLNSFTGRQQDVSILVFENNTTPVIYSDTQSIGARQKSCFTCGIVDLALP